MNDYNDYMLAASYTTPAGHWHGWQHPLAEIRGWRFNKLGDLQSYCDHKIAELVSDRTFSRGKCELVITDDYGRRVASAKHESEAA